MNDDPTTHGKKTDLSDLDARIAELEVKFQEFRLSRTARVADDVATNGCTNGCTGGTCPDTNGCTNDCTHNCTNGCTGGGCLADPIGIGEITERAS